MSTKVFVRVLASLVATSGIATTASAQILLRDDFALESDTSVWRLPFGEEGTFVGRTQFRGDALVDIPESGVNEPQALDGRVLEIPLDTYSSIDPGNQFLGTDWITKRNFARAGGVSFSARLRLKPGIGAGVVGGFFLFDTQRDVPPGSGTLVRDEIDWEFLGNQATQGTHQPATNYWNDGTFASGGSFQLQSGLSLDLTQFHDYRVDWSPQSLRWFVDNQLVREQTSNVPDDPMKLHFNLWAPDSTFAAAYSNALQPAASAGANKHFVMQVDHVEVNRINTQVSQNLLVDGSFEQNNSVIAITPSNGGQIGTWLKFGNVFLETDTLATDGTRTAKMFGPFNGNPDASGLLQNVPAAPGDEFEASVDAYTKLADSIMERENFTTIALSFLDSQGHVLQEALGSPGNLVNKNGKDFPLLDGRDPNLVADQVRTGVVNAIAPAGTASVRVSLFFVQQAGEGGAAWFDHASLVKLTPGSSFLLTDLNQDHAVDAADAGIMFGAWGTADTLADLNHDGIVDAADAGILFADWTGDAGPAQAVPEPGLSVSLVGLAIALVARGRDRNVRAS